MPDRKKGIRQRERERLESIQVLAGSPALRHQLLFFFFNCIYPSPGFGGHVSSVRCKMKEEMLCRESVITLVNWVIHHLKTV